MDNLTFDCHTIKKDLQNFKSLTIFYE